MNAEPLAVGVDIGGTKIAFALVNHQGQVVAEHRLPTAPQEGVNPVLDRVAAGIQALLVQANAPVQGIGIGSPGFVNPVTGVCRNAVNLGWQEVALRDEIQQRLQLNLPIIVQRDTNAGTVGEWLFGAGRGEQNFAYIAVGTGLGLGAISGGQLLLGGGFLAMEFGHTVLVPQGRLCGCGQRGCGEAYISGMGLVAGYKELAARYPQNSLRQLAEVTVNDILAAGFADDPLGRAILDEAIDQLAAVIAYCMGIIDPDLFIIGGGLGLALYDWMLPRLETRVRARMLPVAHDHLRLARSQVTSSAVGAAALVWQG